LGREPVDSSQRPQLCGDTRRANQVSSTLVQFIDDLNINANSSITPEIPSQVYETNQEFNAKSQLLRGSLNSLKQELVRRFRHVDFLDDSMDSERKLMSTIRTKLPYQIDLNKQRKEALSEAVNLHLNIFPWRIADPMVKSFGKLQMKSMALDVEIIVGVEIKALS
jgi:hypothetical protein